MPYLVAADLPTESAGKRFRAALAREGIWQLPGAHNGQAAIQARNAGFDGVYLSGAAMTASMGLPDLGIITVDEVAFFIRQIARASGLPLLVDGDTGYGEALNVMHMVRTFEEAGAGAVHLEDQILPKKCGHLNGKALVPALDMAAKVAAAKKASRDIVIMARTDAAGVEGFDAAVDRAKMYVDAGADCIFPEALNTREMFEKFAKAMPGVPLLANMTEFGKTPFYTAAEFEQMGYKMVIWPVSSLRVANKAQSELYASIKANGGTHKYVDRMQTRQELYDTIGLHGVPLLANMTEFGKTPFYTAAEFEQMGYKMVIWPVSSLRVANKAQSELYASIKANGGTHKYVDRMQTRQELYDTIGLHTFEELDASIIKTIVPQGMPQED